ncbi:MAG: hypothetical protein HQK56_13795 [Deltaproteobacteria bacterium]|nr:hypothetical protein [Deltaproteobacteria bacterium]
MHTPTQESMLIEPGQAWEVDFFRPEDAAGVVNLFLTVYGREYPIKTFIQPDRLIEENADRRTISTVARTPKGDIVGHTALFISGPWEEIYESGSGAVLPDYRGGHGIFTQLVTHNCVTAAEKFGVAAVMGESVCNHIFTQRVANKLKNISCALEVDLMPAAAYEKEKSSAGRVAALMGFMTKKPRPQLIYLPASYEKQLRLIYSHFDDERSFTPSDGDLPDDVGTNIKTQVFDFAQVARLAVFEAGADFVAALIREEEAARSRGMVVIQVWLKLSWPWVGRTVAELRRLGYFLGGAMPRWFDDDGLLMQKIIGRPNWAGMKIEYDWNKELVALVEADWSEVTGQE